MEITEREIWTLVHGMGFGALYLLAFAGGLAGLYSLRTKLVTPEGITERMGRLQWGGAVMAVCIWLTVIVGTYIVYPWYRAKPPEAVSTETQSTELREFPRYWLLASESTAQYHEFGMEWKEHVAWITPFLATAVAVGIFAYGRELATDKRARMILIGLFVLSFALSGIAGLFGALITKAAPII